MKTGKEIVIKQAVSKDKRFPYLYERKPEGGNSFLGCILRDKELRGTNSGCIQKIRDYQINETEVHDDVLGKTRRIMTLEKVFAINCRGCLDCEVGRRNKKS